MGTGGDTAGRESYHQAYHGVPQAIKNGTASNEAVQEKHCSPPPEKGEWGELFREAAKKDLLQPIEQQHIKHHDGQSGTKRHQRELSSSTI